MIGNSGGGGVIFDKMRKNVYFSILIIVPHVNICCSDKNWCWISRRMKKWMNVLLLCYCLYFYFIKLIKWIRPRQDLVVGRFHTPIQTFRHNFCTFTHNFITNHISSAERTTQPLSTLAGILKKRGDGARFSHFFFFTCYNILTVLCIY